ncbi:hypothetical protein Rhal01_02433 [Rubritalea halochordaticola]|uniref:Solute-binding protein family 5 domain-containing protein n=1 Tax=Rubritalea halochordaticola TaxID=714537 RepID=A0ABP9V2P0_9BACT
MRFLTSILATGLAFSLLSSCQKETQITTANREDILIMGNGNEPKGLDPHRVSGVTESKILRALFEGLVQDDPVHDKSQLPGAAESWTHNEDKSVWTFNLRKNAKWSDGTPVTSEDFVFAYHRMLRPETASPFVEMLYFLKNAKQYNRSELGFILCGQDPNFPVKWDTLKEIAFQPSEDAENQYAKTGLDNLKLKDLESIKANLASFPWPDTISTETQNLILDRLIEYRQAEGVDLWDKAHVGVTALDDYTLKLELRGPTTFLPQLTKHFTWYPVPKHLIMDLGKGDMSAYFTEWTSPENMVSNGPFQLKSWRMNHSVDTERNPHYWDAENVKLDGVRFLPINNLYTEARMFMDEQVHITSGLPSEVIDEIKVKQPELLRQDIYVGCIFYRCNTKRKPLDDVRVREALSLCIDKNTISEKILRGYKPAYAITPPMEGYDPPHVIDYDIEKARKLLADAGYPNGEGFPRIKILIASRETARTMAEAVQASFLENLNINVEIENKEWAAYLTAMHEGDYDIAGGGWIGDYLDPLTFLEMWTEGNANNNTGFADANFEGKLKVAGKIADEEARFTKLQEAERIFLESHAIMPVAWYSRNYLIHPAVKNYTPLLLDNHPYKQIELIPAAK